MNKLVLGTAQFGMDFGINNKRGKIPRAEVFEILESALKSGIDTIDTASSYGDSEEVIGEFIRSNRSTFKIISKLPGCRHPEVGDIFESSLKKLGVPKIYGYLIHSFPSYKNDEKVWGELEDLQSAGKVKKIGFSLYSPDELEYLMGKKLKIDIVQVPFSVFDQRFERYLPGLKKMGVEIHARSIFLQGLVFKKPDNLDGYFKKIRDKIECLNRLTGELGIPIVSLCTGFVMANGCIDKAVVGVDSLQNFIEIEKSTKDFIGEKTVEALSGLRMEDEDIVLPFNWKLSKVKN